MDCNIADRSLQPEILDGLAEKISITLHCKSIRVRFGDASGHLEYFLYDDGEVAQGYSFGDDYSAEMAEFGQSPREARANETLVRANGCEYVYFSNDAHPNEDEITGGMEFLNFLFIEQKAELRWNIVINN